MTAVGLRGRGSHLSTSATEQLFPLMLTTFPRHPRCTWLCPLCSPSGPVVLARHAVAYQKPGQTKQLDLKTSELARSWWQNRCICFTIYFHLLLNNLCTLAQGRDGSGGQPQAFQQEQRHILPTAWPAWGPVATVPGMSRAAHGSGGTSNTATACHGGLWRAHEAAPLPGAVLQLQPAEGLSQRDCQLYNIVFILFYFSK